MEKKDFMNKNLYVLDYLQDNQFHAGSKARDDINKILTQCNIESRYINVLYSKKFDLISKLLRNISYYIQIYNLIRKMKCESALIVQYPFLKDSTFIFLNKLCKKKHIKIITIIHDLDSIRDDKGADEIQRELGMLNLSNYIIVHNNTMKKYICEYGIIEENKLICLGIFDYLVDDNFCLKNIKQMNKVIIAGNLSITKSPYVYKLNSLSFKHTEILLYGVNYTDLPKSFVKYEGVFAPNSIPFHEGFGLVWDGDSIDTCNGNTGNYTKINNPHKFSLYMAAGIPVFVWRKAAVAKFVEENKLGYCIDSLDQIDQIINDMTMDDYRNLKNNVNQVSQKVRSGFYIKSALNRVMVMFEESEGL